MRPIPVKHGLSKSVRPKSKIEILEVTAEVQALLRKGHLRLTGKPKGAQSVAEVPVPKQTVADVLKRSEMAGRIAEKGLTTSATIPPVSRNPEMTDGELVADEKGSGEPQIFVMDNADADDGELDSESDADGVEEVDQADMLNDNQKKRKIKRRRN